MKKLQEQWPLDSLRELFAGAESYAPFPKAMDRAAWDGLRASERGGAAAEHILEAATEASQKPWPELPASLYLDYARTGNRERFQIPYFERRQQLGYYAIALAFDPEALSLDTLLDALWSIHEEATWCLPAHNHHQRLQALPHSTKADIDLFAAQTAHTLAETLYLHADRLNDLEQEAALQQNPATFADNRAPVLNVVDRIHKRIRRDIIQPLLDGDEFWWFSGRNNWTPWIAANVLGAALYLDTPADDLARLTHLLNGCIDRFIEKYPDDGACDEGPSYWQVSPGALALYLEHLHTATDGAVSLYDEPKIRAMAAYLPRVHLLGSRFANFADAPARTGIVRGVAYRFGERTGEKSLCDLVLHLARDGAGEGPFVQPIRADHSGSGPTYPLRELFWLPVDPPSATPRVSAYTYFPATQIALGHEQPATRKGFSLAVKGGHNGENHNHNDLGHTILLHDGIALLADIGSFEYSRETFGPNRYDLVSIGSHGHNAPSVNGHRQLVGKDHAAKDVEAYGFAHGMRFFADLTEAFDAEAAGLKELTRAVMLHPGAVTLTDSWALARSESLQWVLFSEAPITAEDTDLDAATRFSFQTGERTVQLTLSSPVQATLDFLASGDDVKFRGGWDDGLHRLTLTLKNPPAESYLAIRFTR